MFAFRGRIGRMRYLAYTIVLTTLMLIVSGLLVGIFADTINGYFMLAVLMCGPSIIVSVAMAVRRLHDLDQNGWLSLLILVPLVNFFLVLWFLFAPGTQGGNRYGPAPSPNTTAVKVLAWGGLILGAALVIFAAVAVPAYMKYQQRSANVLKEIEKAKQAPRQ